MDSAELTAISPAAQVCSLHPPFPFGFELAPKQGVGILTRHTLVGLQKGGALVERGLRVFFVPAVPIVRTAKILKRVRR
jgi:hypothetical protein